jgi:pSer/pThr/pTyr-binding forkhead associated (FHA) protein
MPAPPVIVAPPAGTPPAVKPVSTPTPVRVPPKVAPPRPPAPPTTPSPGGTVIFTGLGVPRIEATVSEKKPDGSVGKSIKIAKETSLGRAECDLTYPEDPLLSPRHASLEVREGKLYLKDLGSQNGTFVRQRQDSELTPGDVFLLGRELFRFTTQSLEEAQGQAAPQGTMVWQGPPKFQRGPLTAKLERIRLSGEVVEEFKLDKPETTLGRTAGDLAFKDDPYMSGTHARIVAQPGRFILQDLRSRNGIYRRLRNEAELQDGDEFFLGEQLFRVEIKTL